MKLIRCIPLVVSLLFPLQVSAQSEIDSRTIHPTPGRRWAFGAKLGWNFGVMTLDPKPSEDAEPLGLFGILGGIESRYSLLANLHLDAQLLYTMRNSRWEGREFLPYASTVYLRYVDLPVSLQWYPMRGASQWTELPSLGLEPFIFGGGQLSYLLFASHVVDLNTDNFYPEAGPNIADQLNRLELSALGGAGLRLHFNDHLSLSAEGSINVGLTDVNDSYTYAGKTYIGKSIEARWLFGLLYRPD